MSTENGGKVTHYSYSNDGALASIVDDTGVQQQFHYNAMGHLEEVSVIDSSGEIITTSSIADHRDGTATVLDSLSGVSSTFTYSLSGEIGSSQTFGYPTFKRHQETVDGSVKTFSGDHVSKVENKKSAVLAYTIFQAIK